MVTEQKKVFVTGASGQTGRHCLKYLQKQGEKIEISAGIYSEDQEKQSAAVKSHFPNVKISAIDADDVNQCAEAFNGVSDLFIVPSATEAKVRHARNYIRAAKLAKVPFVLVLSMTGSEDRSHLFADQFNDIEEEVKRQQLPGWCILRTNFYTQNLMLYKQQISEGKLPLPIGDSGKFAPVDVDDVGEVAASILTNCEQHKGKVYTITGSELLSGTQMAEKLSKHLGTKLNWENIQPSAARSIIRSQNVPYSETQGLLEFYDAAAHGKAQWVSDDFKKITNRDPNSLEDFCQRHAQELKS